MSGEEGLLRDCPLCGEKPDLQDAGVYCRNCGLYTETGPDEWNTRPAEETLTAELAAAQAEIERLRDGLGKYADRRNWTNFETDCFDVWRKDLDGWETAEYYLTAPPPTIHVSESAPETGERQTDGETTGETGGEVVA